MSRMRNYTFPALLLITLLWPVLIYGSAGYFSDSSGYYRGGVVAVKFAHRKLDEIIDLHRDTATTATDTLPRMDQGSVNGLRSISYSIATYFLSFKTNLLPLVVAQGVLVLLVLLTFARANGILEHYGTMAALFGVGLLTSLPVFTTLATPDVFAGLMILAALLLIFQADQLRTRETYLMGAVVVAAITGHASHVLLAIGMLATAVLVLIANRFLKPSNREMPGRWGWITAPLLIGLAANATMSLIGFGEVSLTPKHYPFALARSIEDGPALWYLNEQCPQRKFAICELYRDRPIPQSNNAFLFGKEGIAARANPTQMDRIRAEEPAIVQAAIRRYPWHQFKSTLANVWQQTIEIGISPIEFQNMQLSAQGGVVMRSADRLPTLSFTIVVQQIITLVALAVTLIGLPVVSPKLRWMAIWSMVFLLANAAICGGISAPAPRYQNRVAWILALIAIPIAHTLIRTNLLRSAVRRCARSMRSVRSSPTARLSNWEARRSRVKA